MILSSMEAESARHKEQAVALYKAIVSRYPKYPPQPIVACAGFVPAVSS